MTHTPDTGPTPETVRKLKPDPVRTLVLNGVLGAPEEDAAEILADVWRALANGLDAGERTMDGTRAAKGQPWRDPVDRMSGRIAAIIHHIYRPWATAMGYRYGKPTNPTSKGGRPQYPGIRLRDGRRIHLSRFELVRRVVRDGDRLDAIEREYGIPRGSLERPLAGSLANFMRRYNRAVRDGLVRHL